MADGNNLDNILTGTPTGDTIQRFGSNDGLTGGTGGDTLQDFALGTDVLISPERIKALRPAIP